jgi:RNA polymerase sigma-70 factor, ECF subfamily
MPTLGNQLRPENQSVEGHCVRPEPCVEFQDGLLLYESNLKAFAISLARCADQAEDLVQETLVRALRAQAQFKPGTNQRAWLFTILRNAYYSSLRYSRRKVEDADGTYALTLVASESQEERIALLDVLGAIDALPAKDREVISLVAFEGFNYSAATKILGCNVGTMKSKLARARRKLARETAS